MEPIIIIALVCSISLIVLVGFLYLIFPTSFWDLLRINYYKCFITENGTVVKVLIEKQQGQYYLKWNKRAYLIPKGATIRHKSGNIFYADIQNTMPIRITTKEEEDLLNKIKIDYEHKQIKSASAARKLLSKIPLVNKFVLMKKDEIDEVVFANKFALKPLFIFDACMMYIILNQMFTEKIMKEPKSLMDVISENATLIIIGLIIIIPVAYYISAKGGI